MSKRSERGVVQSQRRLLPLVVVAVVLGLLGLPVAVWLDLSLLSERILRQQASETGRLINDMRGFYAEEVVDRVLKADRPVSVTHEFRAVPGGIPIPATLSIELGRRISHRDGAVGYKFVSDLPFRNRDPYALDAFEHSALDTLRRRPTGSPGQPVVEVSGSVFDRQVRIASPILMGPVCVSCHNSHPLSPKTDWAVGDVRGIQEVTIRQPIEANVFAFKFLLGYLALAAAAGIGVILLQGRQARLIGAMNRELSTANDFLAAISLKIAKYLPPQIYKRIFSGEKDVVVQTERKKLTIFFSDIKDFTASTERLQPEELTALLNEYFTEMAAIAARHGGTIDKFIGDAMLVFFGDPETLGVKGDARACLAMAVEMQRRLDQLNTVWRGRGIEAPFRARMGINTGYCNVGNFGSDDRLDYTIIGAEANLAARLQSIAEPGGIMLSFETYSQVRDVVQAAPQPPIRMKGISREVVPYAVRGLTGDLVVAPTVIAEQAAGLELFLDVDAIDGAGMDLARRRLTEALQALDRKAQPTSA
ncbi:adenylate/guanylate cyclase domain-containing protein [uncultured Methylobacterium sp.]|jgi:adenylate cyclase|uniref:adenylate/guanylate cyclase domain-containing protein n=1 Tax=uncultured Methylobacterium sp. TaxID=157278 RepID=UPI0026061A35|nr:adenylate/guanylate cyclase domain-containing protein [uncultured Methylobacterium sp.]